MGGAAENTVTVDGAGSKWTNTFSLYVGRSGGNGTMNITGGGAVSNTSAYVGDDSGSTGMVAISGDGSTWTNNGSLYVGSQGTGTVTQTGGTTSIAGTLYLGRYSTGSGTYTLNGGVLAARALSAGAGAAAFNFGGGTLRATGGFSTGLPMTLTGTGGAATVDTQSYAVTLSGILSGNGGITKLGAGSLTLTGANSYAGLTTVKTGTLELSALAESPVLAGAGADVQGGKLVLDYASGSDIALTVRNLLKSGKIESSTAGSRYGLGWIDDTADDKVIVMYTVKGDANLDYTTNGGDLNVVLAHYNQTGATWAMGDVNYDGTVNGGDLNIVLANYNQHYSSVVTAVPEPGALALLLMAASSLAAYAWRKRT